MHPVEQHQHVDPRWRLLVLVMTAAIVGSSLAAQLMASAAVGIPVTYQDHNYSTALTKPNADKPQSKLRYHDGAWWASMVEAGGTGLFVHELLPDHTWRNTGALVDSRRTPSSRRVVRALTSPFRPEGRPGSAVRLARAGPMPLDVPP
jgi:hypothetical protein